MVYRIVQLHDGDIEVESTKNRGTTFRVLLPRANET
jgi:signal transduction histidine kinase